MEDARCLGVSASFEIAEDHGRAVSFGQAADLLMQRLDLKRGQELHITELPGGGFQALPYDPDFERTMEIADEVMDKYRDTLAVLAK